MKSAQYPQIGGRHGETLRTDRLVWVGGVGVEVAFACAPDEAGVQPIWIAEGDGGSDSDSPSNAA